MKREAGDKVFDTGQSVTPYDESPMRDLWKARKRDLEGKGMLTENLKIGDRVVIDMDKPFHSEGKKYPVVAVVKDIDKFEYKYVAVLESEDGRKFLATRPIPQEEVRKIRAACSACKRPLYSGDQVLDDGRKLFCSEECATPSQTRKGEGAESDLVTPLSKDVTREMLAQEGKLLYRTQNSEEYQYKGEVYVCRWRSPQEGKSGGWVCWKRTASLQKHEASMDVRPVTEDDPPGLECTTCGRPIPLGQVAFFDMDSNDVFHSEQCASTYERETAQQGWSDDPIKRMTQNYPSWALSELREEGRGK